MSVAGATVHGAAACDRMILARPRESAISAEPGAYVPATKANTVGGGRMGDKYSACVGMENEQDLLSAFNGG